MDDRAHCAMHERYRRWCGDCGRVALAQMADIGKPIREIEIIPVEEPVPQFIPLPDEAPPVETPEPVREPDEVPA